MHKTETITRNPLGQPDKIVASNPTLTQTFVYDAAHRLVSETDSRTGMSTAKTLTRDWSPGGLLNMVQDGDGHRTDYLYDVPNRGGWSTSALCYRAVWISTIGSRFTTLRAARCSAGSAASDKYTICNVFGFSRRYLDRDNNYTVVPAKRA